jgi:predicted translin family RNA/ssDNA-binding protein
MAEVVRIDCRRQPVSFYDKVTETRAQRQKVNEAVRQLKSLIDQYREGVHTFQVQHVEQLTGGRT